MEKKLFPELLKKDGIHKIMGHRLSYDQITSQQEVIQTRGWNSKRKGSEYVFGRPTAILLRGILQNPSLYLAFKSEEDAQNAASQHLCLCRNEDLLFPDDDIIETTDQDFIQDEEKFPGYELVFEQNEKSFLVGYHRLSNEPMYGWIRIVGQPVNTF